MGDFEYGGCCLYSIFLRPANTFYSATETFLLGTLPSLFGAAGFVTVLFIYYKIYLKRLGRYKLLNSIVFSFSVTFFGFLLWEVIRMGLYPFDIYDVIMTLTGCLLSTILILVLFYKDLNQDKLGF